jgi:hypothetical protein
MDKVAESGIRVTFVDAPYPNGGKAKVDLQLDP